MPHTLTRDLASHFARTALGHVTREYPNKLDHVLTGPEDVKSPRELHPIFYGSFDWHSCVHGYWTLVRCLRRFPDLPEAGAIRALFDAQFTPEKVAGEVAYLARPSARGFERPYGWAWALKLQGDLLLHENAEGRRWVETMQPLADAFVERFRNFLPLATYPTRAGTHGNSAFATALALDYARVTGDTELASLLQQKARAWYGTDANYNGFEPSQDDFLSPSLMEAACMSRALDANTFLTWFQKFLPHAEHEQPAFLFVPATVSDRSDGKIAHLDGLNFSRAWCWMLILEALPQGDLLNVGPVIERHIESALPHVVGDYMGEHWLASFALLALDPYPD
ncbi:MAG TPA: DUF2891 domain-containing protein [Rhizomicrobium sp.]|nr:DUF2891 domain-containing protein [Rhizomicrobium sp.]